MPFQTILTLLFHLATPLAVLAAPISRRFDTVPFAPATSDQPPFKTCATQEINKGPNPNPASMSDCLMIGQWAAEHNGLWTLTGTTATNSSSNDDDGWRVLHQELNCALLVKNTEATSIGNQDVADLIEAIYLGDGIRVGSVEEVGTFGGCPDQVNVSFLLRDAKF
ncbi:hypothetical protein GGS21DRAFT_31775 [Xylaria nigripes]|nr:hypothetical protein GGS21DRAFT_31775 [Xylaria nigripes]